MDFVRARLEEACGLRVRGSELGCTNAKLADDKCDERFVPTNWSQLLISRLLDVRFGAAILFKARLEPISFLKCC